MGFCSTLALFKKVESGTWVSRIEIKTNTRIGKYKNKIEISIISIIDWKIISIESINIKEIIIITSIEIKKIDIKIEKTMLSLIN